MTPPLPITNAAAYQFAALDDLKGLRERLLARSRELGLRGTILISTEGVNLFIAGGREQVESLLGELRLISGLENLTPKFSASDHQPFRRMLVRIKKEIIAFGVEGIDPSKYTSPRVSAHTLKQWLDEGRPVTLLDTRNDYEVKLGTFKGALPIGIDHFREFPEAVRRLPQGLKDQPVVTFCTGGIRCEKAAPFLEREGFKEVWQLDGGILKYFEEAGSAHYEGECFVFDQRVGLDPTLQETESSQCYVCQTPLTAEDQKDARFANGESCPYCFKTHEDRMRENIAARQAAIHAFTTPLAGSVPYDNERPLNVPASCDGVTFLRFVTTVLPHTQEVDWRRLCEQGRLLDSVGRVIDLERVVRAGERYVHLQPAAIEPEVSADIRILFEDEAIVVIDKPAPLPMHPGGRFNRNTLRHILHHVYAPQKPHAAHRLDANVTGLVLIGRTRHFAGFLQPQFARGEVEKVYLARVLGHPPATAFVADAAISAQPGPAGAREVDELDGLPARTYFETLRRDADGTSLLRVRPVTGRTNQIRVHLWGQGMPILGDPLYLPGQELGRESTLPVGSSPLCLHALRLSFAHPLTRERVTFEAPEPTWARQG